LPCFKLSEEQQELFDLFFANKVVTILQFRGLIIIKLSKNKGRNLGKISQNFKKGHMKWEISDHNNWGVVKYTSWRHIENYKSLEDRSGVYLFANSDHHVKYVGSVITRRMISEIESAFHKEKNAGASLVKALYTNSDANTFALEKDLITKYNPQNNIN
jgi:hypothetical protein